MFGFGRKKASEQQAVREQFESIVSKLKTADKMTQAAVGNSINMMNTAFFKKYSGVESYKSLSMNDKISYINSLCELEDILAQKDPYSCLGCRLFTLWISAVAENDEGLTKQFSSDLAYFSKIGDLG